MLTLHTHDGVFHADDIFATATLLKVFPGSKVVRSRKEQTGDVITYDVGMVYDASKRKFDHHQVNHPSELARDNSIPYAAFGLVWKEYGRLLCPDIEFLPSTPDILRLQPFTLVDMQLVQAVDSLDTGSLSLPPNTPVMPVSAVISQCLPTYEDESPEALDQAFNNAVALATTILENNIRHAVATSKSRDQIYQQLLNRPDPQYLIMDKACSWVEAVKYSSNPGGVGEQLLYVVFPASDGRWRVQCAPGTTPFSTRKALPAAWAGLKQSELAALTGIPDAAFCHNGRFICGAATKEGAIKMLHLALAEPV